MKINTFDIREENGQFFHKIFDERGQKIKKMIKSKMKHVRF